jgi:translation initiation factor 1
VEKNRLVYSSDGSTIDFRKKQPLAKAPQASQTPALPDDGVVRIFREKGGRGGKTVTVICGLPERGAELELRAGELKRLCGAGGTLREGAIEIQGDHRDRVAEKLRALGYRVKLAGG